MRKGTALKLGAGGPIRAAGKRAWDTGEGGAGGWKRVFED